MENCVYSTPPNVKVNPMLVTALCRLSSLPDNSSAVASSVRVYHFVASTPVSKAYASSDWAFTAHGTAASAMSNILSKCFLIVVCV